jgi:hypothetical protein
MAISRWQPLLVILSVGCNLPPIIIGGDDAGQSDAGQPDSGTHPGKPPEVLLLLDTSGSMVFKAGCECTTTDCTECLPDCSMQERTRWFDLVSAVSGKLESFTCSQADRTAENGATYDIGYPRPFYVLGDGVVSGTDGLLDRYKDSVHFGLATFDTLRTYVGASDLVSASVFDSARSDDVSGQWSFGSSKNGPWTRPDGTIAGLLELPTSGPFLVDTGIVSFRAAEGALIMPDPAVPADEAVSNIKNQLRYLRPYGGTPIASALDDLYLSFASKPTDPDTKRYILLVTDGAPDDDFRTAPTPGCDCVERGTCPGVAAEDVSCPYPTATVAAQHLFCGYNSMKCVAPIAKVFAIGYSAESNDALSNLLDIAAAGGGQAFKCIDGNDLPVSLNAAMEAIILDASGP